jgi:hypothetical protein
VSLKLLTDYFVSISSIVDNSSVLGRIGVERAGQLVRAGPGPLFLELGLKKTPKQVIIIIYTRLMLRYAPRFHEKNLKKIAFFLISVKIGYQCFA